MKFVLQSLLITILCLSTGCGGAGSSHQEAVLSGQNLSSIYLQQDVTGADRQKAFRRASLVFLKQAPSADQLNLVQTEEGYNQQIDQLIESTDFVSTLRTYHQDFFKLQGEENNVNLNEPANLAALLIRENRDFRDILRANYCVDNDLNQIPCSSFGNDTNLTQENGAGVVTTQAFLRKWQSSFSFVRASEMLQAFSCQEYPDNDDDGLTPTEISESVHTFACTTCVPQCYSCHRTMNPRAALFYTFDTNGVFNLDPSNNVAIKRDDGRVSNTSDLIARNTIPRFKQKPVATLKEYALELTRTSRFSRCLAKRFTLFSLGSATHNTNLPLGFEKVENMIIKNQFRIKDFYSELLRSKEYVLQ